jgi:hypothetical protein
VAITVGQTVPTTSHRPSRFGRVAGVVAVVAATVATGSFVISAFDADSAQNAVPQLDAASDDALWKVRMDAAVPARIQPMLDAAELDYISRAGQTSSLAEAPMLDAAELAFITRDVDSTRVAALRGRAADAARWQAQADAYLADEPMLDAAELAFITRGR